VVTEGADGSFGSIAVVDMEGDKLELNSLFMHEIFEDLGAFIVEALELGVEAGMD
jgi:hypothetical protein